MSSLLLILLSTMLVNVFVAVTAPGARGYKDAQGRLNEEWAVAAFGAAMLSGVGIGAYLLEHLLIKPAQWGYLRTLAFLGFIAALTPVARRLARTITPDSSIARVRFIEALTSNAAFLGVALFSALHMKSWIQALELGVGSGFGFAVAMLTFGSLRERVAGTDVPKAFRGTPIALITAGIMALALLGLAGLIKI